MFSIRFKEGLRWFESYNGWTNWDTWDVALWLTNDASSDREARDLAKKKDLGGLKRLAKNVVRDKVNYGKVNWNEIMKTLSERIHKEIGSGMLDYIRDELKKGKTRDEIYEDLVKNRGFPLIAAKKAIDYAMTKMERTLTVRRVSYGKASTPEGDREYQIAPGGPVGNRGEWIAWAKDNGFTDVKFVDSKGGDYKVRLERLMKEQSMGKCAKCGKPIDHNWGIDLCRKCLRKLDKPVMEALKPNKFYLVDLKRKVYTDEAEYDTEDRAIKGNMIVQMASGNDYVIPMKGEDIKKQGFRKGRIDVYQPVGESIKESDDMVSLSREDARELQKLYDKAVASGQKQFKFKGRDVLTDYAKYMLQYLKMRGFREKLSRLKEDMTTATAGGAMTIGMVDSKKDNIG